LKCVQFESVCLKVLELLFVPLQSPHHLHTITSYEHVDCLVPIKRATFK
jgi:hypothetical protein